MILIDKNTKKPILIIGAEGGAQIISGVSSVIIRNLLFKDDIKVSIDAPKIHDQLFPNTTEYETHWPDYLTAALKAKGHILENQDRVSCVTAIGAKDGKIYANTDYYKGGSIDGY